MIAVALVHHRLAKLNEMALVLVDGRIKLRYLGRLRDIESPGIWLDLDDGETAQLDDALRDAWDRLVAMVE